MEPVIVDKSEMTLVGMVTYGQTKNEIVKIWERFDAQIHRVKNASLEARYALIIWNDETEQTGNENIFVGVQVEQVEDLPKEMFVKVLPASQYAKITVKASELDTIWGLVFGEWLPASNYQDKGYIVESYPADRYDDDNLDDSEIDVFIPIRMRT
jgi:AraC family transcriptional regulator